MDNYVLARSAFNHSVKYRSAMVYGRAQGLTDPDEIAALPGDDNEAGFPVRAGLLPMATTLAPAGPPGPPKDLALPEEPARLIASGNLR